MKNSTRTHQPFTLIITWSIIAVLASCILISCTLSFQNISTHGTATDLVDEDQSPKNDISPTVSASGMPNLY